MDPNRPDTLDAARASKPYGLARAADFGYVAPPLEADLQLQQVHYVVRHGERTPVRERMTHARPPIPGRWNMCHEGNRFRAAVLNHGQTTTRVAQVVNEKGDPLPLKEGDCLYGELTDLGRRSTFGVGQRLRQLYGKQLGFLPDLDRLSAADMESFSFRSTNMPRTVESLQQVVAGLLSGSGSPDAAGFVPRLLVRDMSVEDLLPNTVGCGVFRKLDEFFAAQAALLWNPHLAKYDPDIKPHTEGHVIRVDSHPRLNGIMDTVNASIAHGVAVPRCFVDNQQLTRDMERAVVTEWFSGYRSPDAALRQKYRRLAMGRFLNSVGDCLERKADSVGDGKALKLAVYAAHDTSLASILSTVDAFEDRWPAFTASLGIELYKDARTQSQPGALSRIGSVLGLSAPARSPHYVRFRFGDETLRLPACAKPGDHLDSHPEFCTLNAFLRLTRGLKRTDGVSYMQECNMKP